MKITISRDQKGTHIGLEPGMTMEDSLGLLHLALSITETRYRQAVIKQHKEEEIPLTLNGAAAQLATLTQKFLDQFPPDERKKRLKAFRAVVAKTSR